MTRRVVGPFNRVEGDLEVMLDVEGGHVAAAFVNSPLYRGFEQILEGKTPLDPLVFVPRICGICSVAQSAAAARALADAAGIAPPRNGRLAANLTLAVENLADHLTHFYLFFMPDFAAAEYAGASWYAEVSAQFRAQSGKAQTEALAARTRFMQAMGLLAGKWPHTLAVQPGGTTRPLTESEIFRLRRIVREFRAFLEARLFAASLETIAGLDGQTALERWRKQARADDLRLFLQLADRLDLWSLGQSGARFLSVGAYDEGGGAFLFAPGVWHAGTVLPFAPHQVSEDVSCARYVGGKAQRPEEERTVPRYDKPGAYSWCKAPRLDGEICETGALARQLVDGQPLVSDLVARRGAGVGARVLARLLEFARVVPALERWLDACDPDGPWCMPAPLAENCLGVGFVEAARGALGHWLTVRHGLIGGYQIIAPTTWNFSPRDADGQPGALERALVGLPVPEQGTIPAVVHHVVRSFDPCMVCTVH
ncbi:MAG: nickel-dependent hydrogenase large subunit [Pseudomonadota bacterium]